MQQAQEAAAEAEAQRRAGLGLEMERGVVELQLAERLAQRLELGGIGGEQAAEHHRHRGLEARQHLGRGLAVVGDGVADLAVGDGLDAGDDEADLARAELGHVGRLGREDADLVEVVGCRRRHHADAHALLQHAVLHAHQRDDAEVRVVPAVDQQGLQRRVAVALGRRQALDHRLEQVVDAEAGLGRHLDGVGRVDADHVLDLLRHPLGLGRGQVDLVQDRDDLVVGLDRVIGVGQRLRLDALAGIDHQQRALAGGERAADLVGEVDMARRVHQVQHVGLAVLRRVVEPHGLRLDGDAALALDVHRIEHLVVELALAHRAAAHQQAIGQRALAVVDMGDDREIADQRQVGHVTLFWTARILRARRARRMRALRKTKKLTTQCSTGCLRHLRHDLGTRHASISASVSVRSTGCRVTAMRERLLAVAARPCRHRRRTRGPP